MSEPWATLRVELSRPGDEQQAAAWAAALEGLGALLAAEPDVGGVETRDPGTITKAVRSELWVYTTPAALDRIKERVEALAPQLSLPLRLTGRIREDDDWRDTWKRFYRPRVYGEGDHQVLLRPSWIDREPDDPKLEVVLDPGHAFGTGLHESTRLCLQRLCAMAETIQPMRILDLGCGSGILAITAARLWPDAELVAADTDADATATTEDNARRNGLSERIDVYTGDITAVPRPTFDLIIANILPVVLVPARGADRAVARLGDARVAVGDPRGRGRPGPGRLGERGPFGRRHRGRGIWTLFDLRAPA